ncbi:MAG: ATP-binding protein [Bdellovibrionota bacterium]
MSHELETRTGSPQFAPEQVRSGETLSNLIHKIGHEIGNPLTAIISLATIVERFNDESAAKDLTGTLNKITSYSASIIDEAWKISALNERLVMLLSQKPGNCSPCNVGETIQRAVKKMRSRGRAPDFDVLVSQIGEVPATAFIDSEQLNILLQELFQNAITAAGNRDDDQPLRILVKGGKESTYIALMSDSSQRHPLELSTLFDPFVTTWSEKKRLGLGLTVSWAIVSRFGGTMQLIEQPQQSGYSFTVAITLPAAAPASA